MTKKTAYHNVVKSKEKVTIKYDFTDAEMLAKAKLMSNTISEKNELEDQKKSAMSEFKYKIDSKDAEINQLTLHIQNGYEMRKVECDIEKDFIEGKKKIYHEGKLVAMERLTAEDHQLQMPDVNP